MVDIATLDIYMKAHIEQAVRQLVQAQKAIEKVGTEAQKHGQRIANYLNKFAQYFGFFGSMTDRAFRMMIEATPVLQGYTMEIRLEFERMAYSIGETLAPQFESISRLVSAATDVIEGLPEPLKLVIGNVLLLGKALGEVAPVLAAFSMGVQGLSGAMSALGAAFGVSGAGIVSVLGVIGLGIAEFIFRLASMKIAWDQNWFGMRYTVAAVAKEISMLIARAQFLIGNAVNEIVHAIAIAQIKLRYLTDPVTAAWMEMAENMRYYSTKIENTLGRWANEIRSAWEYVSNYMSTVWNDIYNYYAPGLMELRRNISEMPALGEALAKYYPQFYEFTVSTPLTSGEYKKIVNNTIHMHLNANISSDIDLRDLARKLADYYSDEISKKV